jgi:hypothetical protein
LFSVCRLLLNNKLNISTILYFQQVFLHMGKQAVERHTPWLE